MGDPTKITDSNVKIVDLEGLKHFLKKLKSGKYSEYIQKDETYTDHGKNVGSYYADAMEIIDEDGKGGGYLDFHGFDGWKIITYWYKHQLMFFRDVAVFLDGEVKMEFQDPNEKAILRFKDGKCEIHLGKIQWNQLNPEDLALGRQYKNEPLESMPGDCEKALVGRKI